MKLQKRTTLVPLASILCAGLLTTAVNADEPHRRPHQANKSYGTQKSNEYQRDSHRMITPNAGPKVANGMDFYVSANYIYWKYSRLVNSQATVTSGVAGNNTTNMNDGATQGTSWQPANDWASGFKVAIGTDTSHDGWDVRAGYTWNRFHPKSTFNTNYLGDTNSLNAIQRFAQLNNRTEVDAFSYNKIDLELGRDFKLSPRLTLRPHAGLTGAWLNSDFKVYQNAGEVSVLDNGQTRGNLRTFGVPGSITMAASTKTWGVGLRTGLNYFWMFMKEFGIYANVAADALWMSRDTAMKATLYNSATEQSTVVFNQNHKDFEKVQWVTEFEAGLRYQTMFSDDNYGFMCQLGWEAQTWMNWLAGTDTSFQGANVKLRFDF